MMEAPANPDSLRSFYSQGGLAFDCVNSACSSEPSFMLLGIDLDPLHPMLCSPANWPANSAAVLLQLLSQVPAIGTLGYP